MFFGAKDELDTLPTGQTSLQPALILNFHRADLRAYHGSGSFDGLYRVVLGYDHTDSSGSNVATWIVEPSARWTWRPVDKLTLVAGLEGSLHDFNQQAGAATSGNNFSLSTFTQDLRALYVGSALVEALYRPSHAEGPPGPAPRRYLGTLRQIRQHAHMAGQDFQKSAVHGQIRRWPPRDVIRTPVPNWLTAAAWPGRIPR